MAKSPQWNVKGVDDASRLVARDAARLAGLPIGAWVDRAIKRAAGAESTAAQAELSFLPLVGPAEPKPEAIVSGWVEQPVVPPRSTRGSHIGLALAVMVVLTVGAGLALRDQIASRQTSGTTAPQVASAPVTTGTEPSPMKTLLQMAQGGDAPAQYDLGMRYAAGRDLPKDEAEAAFWFERAAVQGLAAAQYNLGVLYDKGIGVQQDDLLAFFWYRNAAEQGHPRAAHNLATAYADGKGTGKDMAQAAKWFEKAADAGLPQSQFFLAIMYERGLGVEPDPARAVALFGDAAAQGHQEAAERIRQLATAPAAGPAQSTPVPQQTEFIHPRKERPVSRRTVAEIQRLLARLDFEPGAADGVLGRKTVQAISTYQGIAGMEVDGKPSSVLLDDLRAVAGAAKR